MDRAGLVGFYNAPGITLEPVLRAVAFEPGQSWGCRLFLTSFSGAKGSKIAGVTPLYVATSELQVQGGALTGEVIPLFQGTLQIAGANGKVVSEQKVSLVAPLKLQAKVGGAQWRLIACDTNGALIGAVDNAGNLSFRLMFSLCASQSRGVMLSGAERSRNILSFGLHNLTARCFDFSRCAPYAQHDTCFISSIAHRLNMSQVFLRFGSRAIGVSF